MNKVKVFLINVKEILGAALGATIVVFILFTLVYYFITGDFWVDDITADYSNHFNQTPLPKPEMFK